MVSDKAIIQTHLVASTATIHEFAIVREGVVVEDGVVIHPFVVVEPGVTLERNVEIFPGAYIGKEPKGAGALTRTPHFTQRVMIGAGSSIGPHAVVYQDVEIGAECLIGDGASIREGCRIGEESVIGRYVTLNYNCDVRKRVKIMDHSWLCGNMTVGEGVFISGGVLTANDNELGRRGFSDAEMTGPSIGEGAAIGLGAKLLPGVQIGRGAMVGAGSVVTRDVPPDSLVLGAPARVRETHDDRGG